MSCGKHRLRLNVFKQTSVCYRTWILLVFLVKKNYTSGKFYSLLASSLRIWGISVGIWSIHSWLLWLVHISAFYQLPKSSDKSFHTNMLKFRTSERCSCWRTSWVSLGQNNAKGKFNSPLTSSSWARLNPHKKFWNKFDPHTRDSIPLLQPFTNTSSISSNTPSFRTEPSRVALTELLSSFSISEFCPVRAYRLFTLCGVCRRGVELFVHARHVSRINFTSNVTQCG